MDEHEKQKQQVLTEAEKAEIARKEEELLAGWFRNLPEEEAEAWLDAHIEDLEALGDQAQTELGDWETVARVARPLIREHPGMRLGEAIQIIRKKEHKTLAEAEALDAFQRILRRGLAAQFVKARRAAPDNLRAKGGRESGRADLLFCLLLALLASFIVAGAWELGVKLAMWGLLAVLAVKSWIAVKKWWTRRGRGG